jgi:hypothetical protein
MPAGRTSANLPCRPRNTMRSRRYPGQLAGPVECFNSRLLSSKSAAPNPCLVMSYPQSTPARGHYVHAVRLCERSVKAKGARAIREHHGAPFSPPSRLFSCIRTLTDKSFENDQCRPILYGSGWHKGGEFPFLLAKTVQLSHCLRNLPLECDLFDPVFPLHIASL